MPLGEADTRAKLIDPGLHARGWTEDEAFAGLEALRPALLERPFSGGL